MRGRVLSVASSFVLIASPAYAWGDEGHKVIGLIAETYLTPKARVSLAALLGPTDPPMASDIATRTTWADRYRDSTPQRRTATRQWHFVDMEIDGPDMDAACLGHLHHPPASAMPGDPNDCVVDKIEQFEGELAKPSTLRAERQLAVQFLLHFVGDVHQPLHSSDHHDRGGNEIYVMFGGRTTATNLHSFWDTETVQRVGTTPETAAAAVRKIITPDFCRSTLTSAMGPNAAEAWAKEAFALGRDVAYGDLPSSPEGTTSVQQLHGDPEAVQYYRLPDTYVSKAVDVAATQMARAGLRLAAVLNTKLAQQSTRCH